MTWVVNNIKWILVVSGALTCTMLYAAVAPEAALQSTFGETLEGPLAEVIVRSWGALIAFGGGMLIYAAYRPHVRSLVLIVVGLGKACFILLVLAQGTRYLAQQAGIAASVDFLMVILFAMYLLSSRSNLPR